MFLALLSVLAFQVEPRFAMSAEPGDQFVAEVFRFRDDMATEAIDDLVGGAVRRTDRVEGMPEGRRVRIIAAAGPSGERIVVLAPVNEGAEQIDHVCRVSQRTGGRVDNAQRAISWCLTFVGGPTATLDLRGAAEVR